MQVVSQISQMLDRSRRYDLLKRDVTVPHKDLMFLRDGRVALPQLGEPPVIQDIVVERDRGDLAQGFFGRVGQLSTLTAPEISIPGIRFGENTPPRPVATLSPLAKQQIVSKLVGDWALRYLTHADVSDELFRSNITYWQRRYKGRTPDWFIRTHLPVSDPYSVPPGERITPEVRAVLRAGYPNFTNSQILYILDQFSDLFSSEPTLTSFLDGDSVYLRLEFKQGNVGEYSRLAFLRSSETGTGAVHLRAGLKRTSCNNSLVIKHGWKQTHNKLWGENDSTLAATHFARELQVQLPQVFGYADKAFEQLEALRRLPLPDPADAIDAICRARGLPYGREDVRKALVVGSELTGQLRNGEMRFVDQQTAAVARGASVENLVRAFSALPKLKGLSVDQIALAEETAGELLEPGAFEKLVSEGRRQRNKLDNEGRDTLEEINELFLRPEQAAAEIGYEYLPAW